MTLPHRPPRRPYVPVSPYALIGPDCCMYECGMFESAGHAWDIFMGWPSEVEVETWKRRGWRVARVRVVEDGVASDVRAKILAREGGV